MLKIHPLKKYPVDLYYLVDVSASMHNNIEKLNSIGNDLSRKMALFSHDFRLGFGSYVDKTVSPYISIHPERIHNQCRYLFWCVWWGFHNAKWNFFLWNFPLFLKNLINFIFLLNEKWKYLQRRYAPIWKLLLLSVAWTFYIASNVIHLGFNHKKT